MILSVRYNMPTVEKKDLCSDWQKTLACGFGTGLSWGAAYFETNRIICPEIIEI